MRPEDGARQRGVGAASSTHSSNESPALAPPRASRDVGTDLEDGRCAPADGRPSANRITSAPPLDFPIYASPPEPSAPAPSTPMRRMLGVNLATGLGGWASDLFQPISLPGTAQLNLALFTVAQPPNRNLTTSEDDRQGRVGARPADPESSAVKSHELLRADQSLGCPADLLPGADPPPSRERILIELMTSDREFEASREGSE